MNSNKIISEHIWLLSVNFEKFTSIDEDLDQSQWRVWSSGYNW